MSTSEGFPSSRQGSARQTRESRWHDENSDDSQNCPIGQSLYDVALVWPAVEFSHRNGKLPTAAKVMLWFLVAFNCLAQFGTIFLVGHAVLAEERSWREELVDISAGGDRFWWLKAKQVTDKTMEMNFDSENQPSHQICTLQNTGYVTCAPLVMHKLDNWSALDLNMDGFWTYEEAAQLAPGGQNFTRVFTGLAHSADWLLQKMPEFSDLTPEARMRLWQGETLSGLRANASGTVMKMGKDIFDVFHFSRYLCTLGNRGLCGNMVARGIFDYSDRWPSLQDAYEYCDNLMRDICPAIFGPQYQAHMLRQESFCGTKSTKMEAHVVTEGSRSLRGDKILVANLDWSIREVFSAEGGVLSREFLMFLTLIMIFWFVALLSEARLCWLWYRLLVRKKFVEECSFGVHYVEDDDMYEIQGFSITHRLALFGILTSRVIVFVMVAYMGTVWLLNTYSYIDCLLNAVALAWILEIDELMYLAFVAANIRTICEKVRPIRFEKVRNFCGKALTRWFAGVDVVGFLFVVVVACSLVFTLFLDRSTQVHEVLDCLCSAVGDRCLEAQYDAAYWKHFWVDDYPVVVNRLRASAGFPPVGAHQVEEHHQTAVQPSTDEILGTKASSASPAGADAKALIQLGSRTRSHWPTWPEVLARLSPGHATARELVQNGVYHAMAFWVGMIPRSPKQFLPILVGQRRFGKGKRLGKTTSVDA
mmetsp:Transcript_38237/g.87526  ORF Transcript_38237/g.87526 Transcript_38237/m.87526 type:complete len:704 (+) Transcript_38237:34-2145(+)|eukprot:CAMPEP_0204333724 /NCGR_PEP_ID=MMETSP0469-20131031/17437_1 /ASSEMBLY_ACC=CAM_ASM_000384 /TAXON_ID=2969 /ORGANISM="Oxyrrhis marina" /LENGTH=703 /DNA_ID=CAMNT_0051317109 /DNA_START=62 /DNA_END=2173 /DNA_ORIENTATION=-